MHGSFPFGLFIWSCVFFDSGYNVSEAWVLQFLQILFVSYHIFVFTDYWCIGTLVAVMSFLGITVSM